MKLLRFGASGNEAPGLMDDAGVIRDLSGHLDDIDGAALIQPYWTGCVPSTRHSCQQWMPARALVPVWVRLANSCVSG